MRRTALPYAEGLLSWTAAAVSVVAFGIFLRTMLPSTGFWDTAEAQTVPHTLSIFHPTGFPTYAMLGWLWSQIPFGDVAWRMNVLSGVCIALSAGLVVLITGHVIDERHPGLRAAAAAIAGGVFAFAEEAWAVAVRADVHALNTFFVALLIWLLFCWRAAERGGARRAGGWLLAAALVFGIALGNHPLVGLMAFGIAVWLFIVDPGLWRRWRLILGCAGFLLLGLATYLYIPIRALTPPEPPLFYARPDTLDRIRYLIFAEQFHSLFDFSNVIGSIGDKWPDASVVLGRQYLGPGWVLAAVGAATLAVRHLGAFVFLGLIVVADIVYSMNFNDGDINRYYLPALVASAPMIGVAVAMIGRGRGAGGSPDIAPVRGDRGTLVVNYQPADQSDNRVADQWVSSAYAQLPQGAVLISWWSYSTPLWYHRWVLGERPDVTIIDERNILDDGYVTIDGAIRRFLGKRPVYVVPPDWDRDRIVATFPTEWVETLPLFSSLLHIREQPPS
ncbi:MAG: DUF2723 domain-containing protein [Chloroflexi bacterium]|nr:MAG: DUF2723 domain-containing protein [Chloroflexota bacterium]